MFFVQTHDTIGLFKLFWGLNRNRIGRIGMQKAAYFEIDWIPTEFEIEFDFEKGLKRAAQYIVCDSCVARRPFC